MGFFKNLFQDNSPNPYKSLTDEQYNQLKKLKKGSYQEKDYLEKAFGILLRSPKGWGIISNSERMKLIHEADEKAYANQQQKNKYKKAQEEMMNKFYRHYGKNYGFHDFCVEYKDKIREYKNVTVIEDDLENERVETNFSGVLESIYIHFTTPTYASITGHANVGTFQQPHQTKEVVSIYPNIIREIKVSNDTIMVVTYFTMYHQARKTLFILKK